MAMDPKAATARPHHDRHRGNRGNRERSRGYVHQHLDADSCLSLEVDANSVQAPKAPLPLVNYFAMISVMDTQGAVALTAIALVLFMAMGVMRPKQVRSSRGSGWDRFSLEQKLILAGAAAILLLLILTRLGITS